MGITLDQLVYDTANPNDGANVGSYIKAGTDGTAIGHVGDALKVDIGSVVDLDIRDLSHAQDSVKIGDGTDFLAVNGDGSLNAVVSATDLDIRDLSHSQDSMKLGDGTEFASITSQNKLEVDDTPNSAAKTSVSTVGVTAVQLAATALASRKRILVQNNGDKAVYLGEANTVTTANGICIPKGASMEMPWGAAIDLWSISSAAGQDVRILEIA